MKKLIFAAFFISALLVKSADAQVHVGLSLNIGTQPDWGPVGYDHVDYYYLPDIGVYYDVPHRQYVYLNGSSWTRTSVLPARYHNYNLYNGYKVVINQPTPYLHDRDYRVKYASYKGHASQAVIRNSHDTRYHQSQYYGHPQPHPQPAHPQPGHPQPRPQHADNKEHGHEGDHH